MHPYTAEQMTPEALVNEFAAGMPYPLDDFQIEAVKALASHHSVLVAAPTGCSSTAERLVWDQEAAGSSPASQTDGRWLSLGEHSGRIREVGGSNPPRPTVRWRVGELVTRLALTQEIGGSSPPAPAARE